MGIYDYNTMPEAKLIFEAMKRKSKEDREYYVYIRKKKDTFGYWVGWLLNNKIEIVNMKEDNIIWVKGVISNMLYVILNNAEEVDEVLDNTTFLDDVIEVIETNVIESVPLSNVDNFDVSIIENAFRSVMKQKLLGISNGTEENNTAGVVGTEKPNL